MLLVLMRVSNCPPNAQSVKTVKSLFNVKRGTKHTAKEETVHKRLNMSSELARQGDVGLKACLTVVPCLMALRRTGEENKANQFIYNSLFNASAFFYLTVSALWLKFPCQNTNHLN